jgi:hypothetical protein
MTSAEHLSSGLVTNHQRDEGKYARVIIIIGEVERVKQIHLADDERDALAVELMRLNEPLTQTQARGERVKRNVTYQKMSLEYWLTDERVYTRMELQEFVNREIERRKQKFINKLSSLPSEDELLLEGLGNLTEWEAIERARALEKIRDGLEVRLKAASNFIRTASEIVRLNFKERLEEEGLMKDDPFWESSLHLYVVKMLDEVEQMMEEQNGKKKKLSTSQD